MDTVTITLTKEHVILLRKLVDHRLGTLDRIYDGSEHELDMLEDIDIALDAAD